MPFKMYKVIFFPEKNNEKRYVCLPYLKFSDPLPETHLFFSVGLSTVHDVLCMFCDLLRWPHTKMTLMSV